MLRLWRENGRNEWLKRFYAALRQCPSQSSKTREGALLQSWNWYVSASIAARTDLSSVFVDDWRLPIRPEARKALAEIDWKHADVTPERVTQTVKAAAPKLFD